MNCKVLVIVLGLFGMFSTNAYSVNLEIKVKNGRPRVTLGKQIKGCYLGTAGGILVGGLIGLFIGSSLDEGIVTAFAYLYYGATAGSSIGSAIGIHRINNNQGNIYKALAGSSIGLLSSYTYFILKSKNYNNANYFDVFVLPVILPQIGTLVGYNMFVKNEL